MARKPIDDLTAAEIRRLFDYSPSTGVFVRRVTTSSNAIKGHVAGCLCATTGYVRISIRKRLYLAHRLAWLHVHGTWPQFVIDHIDGDQSNNRLANLRDVPVLLNMQNQRRAQRSNSTGILGVSPNSKGGTFQVHIKVNRKRVYVGSFGRAEDAGNAYLKAKREMQPGCTV